MQQQQQPPQMQQQQQPPQMQQQQQPPQMQQQQQPPPPLQMQQQQPPPPQMQPQIYPYYQMQQKTQIPLLTIASDNGPIAQNLTDLRFVPQSSIQKMESIIPSERSGEINNLAASASKLERSALCSCTTPCVGTNSSNAWCYTDFANTNLLRSKFPTMGCPILDKQGKNELRTSDITESSKGPVRFCSVEHEFGNKSLVDAGKQAQEKANLYSNLINKSKRTLHTILMVEYKLNMIHADALANTRFMTLEQKLLTAGLMDSFFKYFSSYGLNFETALGDPNVIANWLDRLQRFTMSAGNSATNKHKMSLGSSSDSDDDDDEKKTKKKKKALKRKQLIGKQNLEMADLIDKIEAAKKIKMRSNKNRFYDEISNAKSLEQMLEDNDF
jgi:hypothetical protein